jgi:hypothetical protein
MSRDSDAPGPEPCRLCSGTSVFCFYKTVLGRHRVAYFRCGDCGSVQTEPPTWLDEAYSFPGLHIDVGAPTRSIKNWLAATNLLQAMGFPAGTLGVDFGAGPGLFAGLMRSVGYDFWTLDSYMPPMFSSDHHLDGWDGIEPSIITAFEVFEHLPQPAVTLDLLFGRKASIILFTTWPVDGQPDDWIYFLPESGQHVFFYSEAGLRDRAAEHGYQILVSMYFYILYDPSRLTANQVAMIEAFSLNAVAMVAERIPVLLSSVIMGNPHIDADFAAASARFAERLAATKQARAIRFGPPLRSNGRE